MIKSISKASLITLTTAIAAFAPINSQAQSLTDFSVNCTDRRNFW